MNTTTAPFDDNNVRLALKYALDREALVNTILRGHGVVGNDKVTNSGQLAANKALDGQLAALRWWFS